MASFRRSYSRSPMTAPSSTSRQPVAHGPDGGDPDGVDSPATVRKTLVVLTALGGLLLLAPRQWASAAILLVLSAVLAARHVVVSRREAPRGPAPAAASAPVAAGAGEVAVGRDGAAASEDDRAEPPSAG